MDSVDNLVENKLSEQADPERLKSLVASILSGISEREMEVQEDHKVTEVALNKTRMIASHELLKLIRGLDSFRWITVDKKGRLVLNFETDVIENDL